MMTLRQLPNDRQGLKPMGTDATRNHNEFCRTAAAADNVRQNPAREDREQCHAAASHREMQDKLAAYKNEGRAVVA
jgi:hypothetical protein